MLIIKLCVTLQLAAIVQAQTVDTSFAGMCGQWGSLDRCSTDDGTTSYQHTLTMEGIASGVFEMTKVLYSDSACATSSGTIKQVGIWSDLGPLGTSETSNLRKLQVFLIDHIITPQSTEYLQTLQFGCKCANAALWELNKPRSLTVCPTETCDTTLFGSSLPADSGGLIIGFPAYTVGLYNGTAGGTAGFMHLGKYAHVPAEGFKNAPESGTAGAVQFTDSGTPCDVPGVLSTFCGTYAQTCYPILPTEDGSVVTSSYIAAFEYCGDEATGSFSTASAGWFNRTVTVYDDEDCQGAVAIEFTESGTMSFGPGASTGEQSTGYMRYAPSMYVLSNNDTQTDALNKACPCGDTWQTGKRRRLTQCMDSMGDSTCTIDGVYSGVTIGSTVYGTSRRTISGVEGKVDDLFEISAPSSNQQAATTTKLDPSSVASMTLERDQTIPCPVTKEGVDAFADICGLYHRGCSAAPSDGFFSGFDFEEEIILTGGAAYNIDDGEASRLIKYYPADTACKPNQQALLIEHVGLYTQTSPAGLQSDGMNWDVILINATAYTDAWVTKLNDPSQGCPCGATWVKGEGRGFQGTCAAGTCPGQSVLFGNGTMGTAGYGRMRSYHNILQISPLMQSAADGIYPNGKYTMDSYPLKRQAEIGCSERISKDICGEFVQPCHVSKESLQYSEVAFEVPSYGGLKPDLYIYNKVVFGAGDTACQSKFVLNITHAGKVRLKHRESEITLGEPVELVPEAYFVEPGDERMATLLNAVCPCDGIWVNGEERPIEGVCPAGTCLDYSWADGPLGTGPMYGNYRRVGAFLRLSDMSADPTVGYKTDFTLADFALISATGDPTKVDHCHGAGSDASESNWSKGGQFSMFAFIAVLVYLVAGFAYNAIVKRDGSSAHVHRDWWFQVFTLVKGGIGFTFGMKDASDGESSSLINGQPASNLP